MQVWIGGFKDEKYRSNGIIIPHTPTSSMAHKKCLILKTSEHHQWQQEPVVAVKILFHASFVSHFAQKLEQLNLTEPLCSPTFGVTKDIQQMPASGWRRSLCCSALMRWRLTLGMECQSGHTRRL